jgi:hypothetical protein
MVSLILLVAALVCLILAAFAVPTARVQVGWLGLALVVIAFIAERWPG